MKVFISYSHKDRDACFALAEILESIDGLEVWYDKGLIPGDIYTRTIAEKLSETDIYAVLISNSSVQSDWVKDELSYAKDHRKRIIPIWIEHTDLPADIDLMLHRFRSLFWYLRGDDAEFRKELLSAVVGETEREASFGGFGNEFSEAENERIKLCLEKEKQGQFSFCYSAENALLIGKAYLFGGAVSIDTSRARHYLKIAAYFGSLDAACLLSQIELEELGDRDDSSVYGPAMDRIRELAEKGSVNAKLFLGNAYWYGLYGVPVSYEISAGYYEECARNGNARAQFIMSSNYYEGDGVVQDYDLAIMFANLAVEQKYLKAWRRWGKFYREGKAVPRDFGKAKEAYERGIRWGDYNCNNKVGDMYYFGWGLETDHARAVEYYVKALEAPVNGQKYALRKANAALGRCYELGTGVERDMKKAAFHYMMAYKYGDMDVRDKYLQCAELSG